MRAGVGPIDKGTLVDNVTAYHNAFAHHACLRIYSVTLMANAICLCGDEYEANTEGSLAQRYYCT